MSAKSTNVFFTLAIKNWANIVILFSAYMCLKSVVQMKQLYPSSGKVTVYILRHCTQSTLLWHINVDCNVYLRNRSDATNI